MNLCNELERKIASRHFRGLPNDRSLCKRLSDNNSLQAKPVQLADDIVLLARLIRQDIVSLAGPCHAEPPSNCSTSFSPNSKHGFLKLPDLIQPLITYLKNQRDNVLDFVAQLDHDLVDSATMPSGSRSRVGPGTITAPC